jgi:hypothetical protein
MFFWIRLCPEICPEIQKGKNYVTFDAYLKVGFMAETALRLKIEH